MLQVLYLEDLASNRATSAQEWGIVQVESTYLEISMTLQVVLSGHLPDGLVHYLWAMDRLLNGLEDSQRSTNGVCGIVPNCTFGWANLVTEVVEVLDYCRIIDQTQAPSR